jgi:arylsulfatase A-like enzyme
MDDAVGAVMAEVRRQSAEENSLVFYIGDNGGPTQSTTSQNGPLRGFKMTTFEGGPRVPFIGQWKGIWPAGATYDKPVMNLDVLPTAVAAAGGKIDTAWKHEGPEGAGIVGQKLDGVDLTPFVTGKNDARPHENLFWRYGEQWAVRSGDWKLVVSRGGSGKPELYDLGRDVGEANDLASAEPSKVAQLQKLYDGWNARQAEPTARDNPNKKAKKQANRRAFQAQNRNQAAGGTK